MKMKKKITAMLLGMCLVTAMSVIPAFAAAKVPTSGISACGARWSRNTMKRS